MTLPTTKLFASLFVCASLFAALPASASLSLVTSRADIVENDFIDWSSLGSSGLTVSSGTNAVSDGGMVATISKPVGNFERRDQGSGWDGNFAAGDALLWTTISGGPITIQFGSLVFGVGAKIQNDFVGAFTATIEAFDSSNLSLGAFSLGGTSTGDGDDSAIFLGVLDTVAVIDHIVFSTTASDLAGVPFPGSTNDFAINRLSLNKILDEEPPHPTPEPGSLALLGLGLAGLGLSRRRRPG